MAGSAFSLMPTVDANPMRHEVERQLDRILVAVVVASHPQPAKLLAFIVRVALGGKDVTEELIRQGVFPYPKPYKEESNIARITMKRVRELLAQYYAEAGSDDPVIIGLPESPEGKRVKFQAGEAYTPEFRYNPRSEIARDFALANHLALGGPSEIEQSLWRFDAILKRVPGHPDAVLGFVEALGGQLLLGIYPDESVRAAFTAAGLEMIARLDPTTADYWRAHMVRGLLHICANDFDAARKEFDIALTLDRQSTVSRGSYVHFLFVTGEQEEALRLLQLKAAERVDDPKTLAIRHSPVQGEPFRGSGARVEARAWTGSQLLAGSLGDRAALCQYGTSEKRTGTRTIASVASRTSGLRISDASRRSQAGKAKAIAAALRLTSIIFRRMGFSPHDEAMKTTLLFSSLLLASLAANAQQGATPQTPAPAKPDSGCVLVQPPPPPKLPSKWQQMIDKQKADFQRKTGIVIPPPPPPKPRLVCPPAPKPAPAVPDASPVQPPAKSNQ